MNDDNEELEPQEPGSVEVDVPEAEPNDVEMLPDGSALISEPESKQNSPKFDENLAENLPDGELYRIAEELLKLLEYDQESRKKRDEMYERGLKLSGLDGETSVGADFDGASHAVHPTLAKAAVEFCARAIKELFPSAGPVKTQIIGKVSEEKLEKAERKKTYLNWQLTKQMPEVRGELEQLLTQLSLAGSQFSKVFRDAEARRSRFEYIPSDQIILPFSATSFATARRKAHIIDITQANFERKVESGVYADLTTIGSHTDLEQTSAKSEAQRIEGKESTGFNEDGLRRLYEVYVWMEIDDDSYTKGRHAPYIITIDEYSRKVVGAYRNWEESDKDFKEVPWIIEWPCIPWRGSLTVGLVNLIGSLAIAATGALNGLLDSAHVNNIPTAVALKGSKVTGSSLQIEPTTVAQVEGPAGVDDIRKLMMPMPYNQPSPVLFSLLGWLTEAAEGVVTTASEKIADASNTGPVGTTYALIEQGAQVFSAIHMRLHAAQAQVLEIVCRLNAKYLSDEETVEELGELVVSRLDFEGPNDICPVSDPNIFSETQRWAQLQEAFKLSQDGRVRYDVYNLHKRALELLKFPQIDEVLPPPNEPTRTNPVAENVNASKGLPLQAFPDEEHIAHITTHLEFATDPSFQMISASATAPLMGHITQHLAYLYAQISTQLASQAAGEDISVFMTDPKLGNQVDKLLAAATEHVHELYDQQITPFKQKLTQLAQQAQQQAQASQQLPPDPASQVALQVGMAEIQRKTQQDQASNQLKAQEVQQNAQLEQMKLQMEAHLEQSKADQKAQTDLVMAHMDKITQILLAELASKTTLAGQQIDAAQAAEQSIFKQAEIEGGSNAPQ